MARSTTLLLALVLAALVALVAGAYSDAHYRTLFEQWQKQFARVYGTANEAESRFNIFKKNVDFIESYNAKKNGVTLGLNKFGDWTHEEYLSMLRTQQRPPRLPAKHVHVPQLSRPNQVDWRKSNAVTYVKDQGQCGSCWAFSTTGGIEGAWAIKTGQLVPLSEQQLLDCSYDHGNDGCNGGLMEWAYQYVIDAKGIESEKSYPYKEYSNKHSCKANPSLFVAHIDHYVNVTSGDEEALLDAISITPVSIAIDASQDSFMFYQSGIYYDNFCRNKPDDLDHGVLAVGYDISNPKSSYYIVKNSWGPSWGMSGYILMAKTGKNQCGVATDATYPVV